MPSGRPGHHWLEPRLELHSTHSNKSRTLHLNMDSTSRAATSPTFNIVCGKRPDMAQPKPNGPLAATTRLLQILKTWLGRPASTARILGMGYLVYQAFPAKLASQTCEVAGPDGATTCEPAQLAGPATTKLDEAARKNPCKAKAQNAQDSLGTWQRGLPGPLSKRPSSLKSVSQVARWHRPALRVALAALSSAPWASLRVRRSDRDAQLS